MKCKTGSKLKEGVCINRSSSKSKKSDLVMSKFKVIMLSLLPLFLIFLFVGILNGGNELFIAILIIIIGSILSFVASFSKINLRYLLPVTVLIGIVSILLSDAMVRNTSIGNVISLNFIVVALLLSTGSWFVYWVIKKIF